MNTAFLWLPVLGVFALSGSALAQAAVTQSSVTQTVNQDATVTTTVQSPTGTTTVQAPIGATTQIVTSPGQSIITRAKDGTKLEMDSDNSVYQVFPDGARTAAPDGIITLLGGSTITIKDGKRIP